MVVIVFKRKEVSKPVQAQDESGGTQMDGLKCTYNGIHTDSEQYIQRTAKKK